MVGEAMVVENSKKKFGDFWIIKIDENPLTIEQLRTLSQRYSESHDGRTLAHSFPGNDRTAAVPPSSQYLEKSGAGLAIPYQKDQIKPGDIWVVPVPSSFFIPANSDVSKQRIVIKHYIAGLYYQVALGNGICVPIRQITGPSGSETHGQSFIHPSRLEDVVLALPVDYEYAWGVGVDPFFTKNHGTFLEQELHKLNIFMHELHNADNADAQQKIIMAIESDYYRAYVKAQEQPAEYYGAYVEQELESMRLPTSDVVETGDEIEGHAGHEDLRSHSDTSSNLEVQGKSLAPICLQLTRLLENVVVPEDLKADIDTSIQQLNHMEARYLEEQIKKANYELAKKQLESAEFWARAKEQFLALMPNKGITIDTSTEPPIFSIRTNLAQKRHVTPVVIVEKIFKRIFQQQALPEDLIKGLLHHLEIFLLGEENSQLVQGLFDYFKHPEAQNGAEYLFKLLAHFYNQFPNLAFDDDYIKIPYKTENCYIMPTLEYCGNKLSYDVEGGEGVFIKMLSKLLDVYNWLAVLNKSKVNDYNADFPELDLLPMHGKKRLQQKVDRVNEEIKMEKSDIEVLNDNDINQISYAIYAMFDYLPLPTAAVEPSDKKLKEAFQRYLHETEERLFELVTNHIHFVFAAYPALATEVEKRVIDKVLNYVAFGINKEELKLLLNSSKDIKLIKEYLEDDSKLDKYTNAPGGNARGFAQQYCSDPTQFENFLYRMKTQVTAILESRLPSDVLKSASASSSPRSGSAGSSDPSSPGSEKEILKGKQRRITDLCINILIAVYEDPANAEKKFNRLPLGSCELMGINIERFFLLFQEKMSTPEKIKLLRKTKVKSEGDKVRSVIIDAFLDLQEETPDMTPSSMTLSALDAKSKQLNELLLSLPGGKDLQLEQSSEEGGSSEQKDEEQLETQHQPIYATFEAIASNAQRAFLEQEHLREENFSALVNEITSGIESVEIKYSPYACVIKHEDNSKLISLLEFLVSNNITFTFQSSALAITYGQLDYLKQSLEDLRTGDEEVDQRVHNQPEVTLHRGSKRAFNLSSGPSTGEDETPRSPSGWNPRFTSSLASFTEAMSAPTAVPSISKISSKWPNVSDPGSDDARKKAALSQPPKSPPK